MTPKRASLRDRVAMKSERSECPSAVQISVSSDDDCPRGRSTAKKRILRRCAKSEPSEKRRQTPDQADMKDLPLMQSLIRDWSKGKLASDKFVEYVAKAQIGGFDVSKKLSATNLKNAARDLIRFLGAPRGAPQFAHHQIHLRIGDRDPKLQDHVFLRPSDFFRTMYHENRLHWEEHIAGTDSQRREVWHELMKNRVISGHPKLQGCDLSKVIPIGIHGDAGSFNKQESIFVFTWNSLSGSNQFRRSRCVMTLVRKTQLVFPHSINDICGFLGHDFNLLAEGVDDDGNELAEGWRAVVVNLRGDWEYFCDVLGFPRWNRHDNMCFKCRATGKGPLSYRDMRVDAPWTATLFEHEDWFASMGDRVATIFQAIEGLAVEMLMIDGLHTIDQGVGAHIIGEIFEDYAICSPRKVASHQRECEPKHAIVPKGWEATNGQKRFKNLGAIQNQHTIFSCLIKTLSN